MIGKETDNDAFGHDRRRFESPWHAELFAIAVMLSETEQLDRATLSDAFGDALSSAGLVNGSVADEKAFALALKTLESALADRGIADSREIDAAQDEWRRAYLATPHGAPIKL